MTTGTLLCATDGSYMEDIDKGTHAAIIDYLGAPDKCIARSSVTPYYDNLCSLVTEQYGLLTLVIMLYQAFSSVQSEKDQFTKDQQREVLIDNEEVVIGIAPRRFNVPPRSSSFAFCKNIPP